MDKAQKRQLKTQWREQQRRAAFAALPLSLTELRAMFDMLRKEVPRRGCDHTRRLTLGWLAERGHDVQRVFAWLDTQGGFCDCEVIMNVPEAVDEAAKARV